MPRRGECIYKRKDGRWEARYVRGIGVDGKKKYGSVYADSYRAVKEKQQQAMQTSELKQPCSSKVTIVDLTQRWLNHIRSQVKLSTYRKYEGLCRNHIEPIIGMMPLKYVTRSMIEHFADKQKENGRKNGGALSAKTVNDILIILNLIFGFAKEEYEVDMPKISLLREEKKEARVLSASEQNQLTAALLADMDIYKFGMLLALYTGLRVGELCALQWDDISDNRIIINKTMQRLKAENGKTEIVIDSPKSNSSNRIIPIPPFLTPYICCFRQPHGYVMRTSNNLHTEPRILQQHIKKLAQQCGLEDVTFHTLRHTFATRCVEAGFDVKTLSEILGHFDVKTTLNRYVHSSFELKKTNMDKLSLSFKIG